MNINTRKVFIYCNMIEYVHTHVYTRNVLHVLFFFGAGHVFFKQNHLAMLENTDAMSLQVPSLVDSPLRFHIFQGGLRLHLCFPQVLLAFSVLQAAGKSTTAFWSK